MGGSLDFAWRSDPLLLYALTLSGLLFGGIFILIINIVVKHGSRLKSQKIQNQFLSQLAQARQNINSNKSIESQISHINLLIDSHKKDIAYRWVRLLERLSKEDRKQYISIAEQTNMLRCIPHCLNHEGIAEKCIALEAIGLSGFQMYTEEAKKYTEINGIAPYACITLTRLIGQDALSHVIESYKKGFISTTQALAAIVEIPSKQIMSLGKATFPIELAQYLEVN